MSSPAAEDPTRSSPPMSVPQVAKSRRSLHIEKSSSLNNDSQSSHVEKETSRQHGTSNVSEEPFKYHDTLITESSSEQDEEKQPPPYSQNHSRGSCPMKQHDSVKESCMLSVISQDTSSTGKIIRYLLISVIVILAILVSLSSSIIQTQSINNPISQPDLLSESIKSVKATFYNQESDIWNDISSAINESISRTPNKPSIILLFASETSTMDCLATELADMSSTILHADKYLVFNPKDFGDDAGEIITKLNEYPSEKKKVVMIRDILNINAEAIKALHNLCDRENPLIAEAIYILTMQTNSYQSSQKKLDFVEKQIYNKLLKSIDWDVLTALVTRITDGAIISVQSQPQLRYC